MRALHPVAIAAVALTAFVAPAVVAPASTASDASLDRVGVWQGPTDATDLNDAGDVRSAVDDGALSRATGVDRNDTLVLGIEVRGFAEAVADADGSNATERFTAAMAEHGDVTVAQTNPRPSFPPVYVHVLEGAGVEVFPDEANDTYYAVVDLAEVPVTRGEDGDRTTLDSDTQEFVASVELAADSPLTEERQYAVAPVEPRWATIETAPDDRVHARPRSNLTINGTTNVGTDWPVTVVLAGDDDPDTAADESFRLTRNATVNASEERNYHYERSFAAAFEDGVVPPGAENVTVDVRFDGRSLLDDPASVELADPRASVSVVEVGDADPVGVAALTVNASLSAGGFLVLHEATPDGPVVGHTEYLAPGDYTATVYSSEPTDADELVAVAHRDANHNEWFDGPAVDDAYAGDDPDDEVALRGTGSTPTAVTTSSSPTTGTTVPPATDTTTTGTTDGTPGGASIPGFGASVGAFALVIALVALVALARR